MGSRVSAEQENTVSDAEACAAVIKAGILRHRGNIRDSLGIAFGVVEGVGTMQRQVTKPGVTGDDDLILLVNAARLKLVVVCSGKRAYHGVGGGIEFRRGDIVGEVLMNAARK